MGCVCFELVVRVLNWLCVLGLAPDAIMMVANRRIVIVLNECTIKSRCRPRKSLPDVTLLSPEVAISPERKPFSTSKLSVKSKFIFTHLVLCNSRL